MLASRRAHTTDYYQHLHHQGPCPQSEPLLPPASEGAPPRPGGGPGPGSCEVTAFALGPSVHEPLRIPCKSRVSVSPSPVELQQSSPLVCKAKCSGGSSSCCQTPQAGEPDVGIPDQLKTPGNEALVQLLSFLQSLELGHTLLLIRRSTQPFARVKHSLSIPLPLPSSSVASFPLKENSFLSGLSDAYSSMFVLFSPLR